jgi:SWI/SNF-related matrix-associated actin-dependent regulator 1 of chromatin subfamily A
MSLAAPLRKRPTLWPYQDVGATFLAQRAGAFLFDEPGLGKTCQAIKGADHVGALRRLVVCPASARENWRREVRKFSAQPRAVDVAYSASHVFAQAADTWIVNYDLVHNKRILRQIRAWAPDLVIADELHLLKNEEARRTLAMFGVGVARKGGAIETAKHVWGLTGTPIPNNVMEIYEPLRAIAPKALELVPGQGPMTKAQFSARYVNTVQGPYGLKVTGSKNLADLRQRLSRFAIRRRKADVLPDLPPFRVEMSVLSSPTAVAALHRAQASTPGVQELIAALAAATMLNDPQAIQEALAAAQPHVAALRRLTGMLKAPLVAEMVEDDLNGGLDKIVVMGVHRSVLDILAERLKRFRPQVLHGGTSADARQKAIDTFQQEPSARVFIGQIVAAGTAITLTAAADLVFAETSWVPADNAQAAMRVHRIGQTKPVLVRMPILAGTIDETVARAVRRKTKDIAALLD